MTEPCETCERDTDTCPYRPRGNVTICGCNPELWDARNRAFAQEMYEMMINGQQAKTDACHAAQAGGPGGCSHGCKRLPGVYGTS